MNKNNDTYIIRGRAGIARYGVAIRLSDITWLDIFKIVGRKLLWKLK